MSNSSADLEAQPKTESELVERIAPTQTHATYIEKDEISQLSEEHRQYLLQRHGTLDLDPVPGFGNADPYNWPTWKVQRPLLHRKTLLIQLVDRK